MYKRKDFTNDEISDMLSMNLDPQNLLDRKHYAEVKHLDDELKLIPHYWAEVNGQIIDPARFQFKGLIDSYPAIADDRYKAEKRRAWNKPTEITEARTAPLYHATSVENAARIINGNELHGNSFHKLNDQEYKGISLTRSLAFARSWTPGSFGGVVFELDQNKLSHNYKFLPIDYFSSDQAENTDKHERRRGESAEAEEFLLTTNLKNFDKYIISVLVTKEVAERWQGFLNTATISDQGIVRFGGKLIPQETLGYIKTILSHPKLKVI